MIKEIFYMSEDTRPSSGKFQISQIGGCKRKMYLEIKGLYKEQYTPRQLRVFDVGGFFHNLAVKTLLEKEHVSNIFVVASEVYINDDPQISGRADLVVSDGHNLMIIDTKSTSDYVIDCLRKNALTENMFKTFERYRKQVMLYLHFFNIKKGYILLIGKSNGEVEEIEVEYNKKEGDALIKEIRDFFRDYVDKNIEPKKCQGGEYGCDCCGIKPKNQFYEKGGQNG